MITEFERLKEVARLVSSYQAGRIEDIDFENAEDVGSRLALALLDPEIMHPLQIPGFAESKSDSYVSVIQSQTKERLHSMVFSLRIRDGSELKQGILHNQKQLFLAEVFAVLGLRESAFKLAQSGYAEALQFELTEHALQFLRLLRLAAVAEGDRKAHASYAEDLRRLMATYRIETEAQIISEELKAMLAATGQGDKKVRLLADKTQRRLAYYFQKHPTFHVGLIYFRVACIRAELHRDYGECVRLCNKARALLQSRPLLSSPSYLCEFLIRECEAAYYTRDYLQLKQSLDNFREVVASTSLNFIIFKQFEFLHQMHCGAFGRAEAVVIEVKASPRFSFLDQERKDRWTLFSLYSQVMKGNARKSEDLEVIQGVLNDIQRRFRHHKRDKAGYNFQLLLLQYIIQLDSKNYNALEESIDSLRVYRNRHLGKGTESSLIAELILAAAKHPFSTDLDGLKVHAQSGTVGIPSDSIQIASYLQIREHVEVSLALNNRKVSRPKSGE